MKTKDEFHRLIDAIEDEEVLKAYFKLIQKLNTNQTGELWNDLTQEEKQELLISYGESFDTNNLISHDEVKKQHNKWLKK
jgi:hypothetical protein